MVHRLEMVVHLAVHKVQQDEKILRMLVVGPPVDQMQVQEVHLLVPYCVLSEHPTNTGKKSKRVVMQMISYL